MLGLRGTGNLNQLFKHHYWLKGPVVLGSQSNVKISLFFSFALPKLHDVYASLK